AAARYEDARPRDPRPGEERVRRQAEDVRELAAEMKLVGAGMVRQSVERDLLAQVIEQDIARPPHARPEARDRRGRVRSEEGCEGGDRLADRDIEGEAIGR